MTKAKKAEQAEAIAFLRERIPPGSKVYGCVRHVSRSGMQRSISLHIVDKDGDLWNVSGWVAKALDMPLDTKRLAVKVGGCGMDMVFHVIMNLSYALHGMETVGAEAKEASAKGWPFTPRADNYRAGYTLIQKDI